MGTRQYDIYNTDSRGCEEPEYKCIGIVLYCVGAVQHPCLALYTVAKVLYCC